MNRFIAFFDVLGFSKYVENNTYERAYNALKRLKNIVAYANRTPALKEFSVLDVNFVNQISFSDSIVLYTNGSDTSDFSRIVHVAKFLIRESLSSATPLRGAISYGEFHAEEDIYFGKGYLDACYSERNQLWAGAFITDNAVKHIHSISDDLFPLLIDTAYIIEYPIPFKESIVTPEYSYAINWANSFEDEDFERKMYHGYAFVETFINDVMQEVPPHTAPNTLIKIDLSSVDEKEKILAIINNTRDFYVFARDKGKIPYSELSL